jgi:aryl-alcohol dehydrogenase-like predicted oxidoreductase
MTAHPSIAGIPLVLGGNVFDFTADVDTSFRILDRFYEHGGRMVDTAQGYSVWVPGHVGGESETVIGQWLASRGVRADMRIATKTGMFGKPGDLSQPKVAEELQKSLERLQTGYVDLYYAHRDEQQTSLEEVAAGFDALVTSGLVREIGASNYTVDRLAAVHTAAHSNGMTPFTILQNEYNLVERDSYGKYRTREDLTRHNRGSSIERFFDKGLSILLALDQVVAETGASHGAVALAWLSRQPGIAAPIASASKPEQLDVQFEALTLELTPDQLDRLTAAGT